VDPGLERLALASYQVSLGTYRLSTKTALESQFSISRGSQSAALEDQDALA
jgi:hypothetical protein